MSAEMRQLAAAIIKMQDQLRNATTTIQLNNSSIEDGVLEIKDSVGSTVMEIGQQWDGSLGATPLTGPEPPIPSTPTTEDTPGGGVVYWDGYFFDAQAMADFARMEVHVDPDPMLTGEYAETLRGTIETPRGGEVHLSGLMPGITYYVRLVCRSTSGKRGPASAIASFTPSELEPLGAEAMAAAAAADAKAVDAQFGVRQLFGRGTDLVINGTGSLRNNTNFSTWDWIGGDVPTGAVGAFRTKTGAQGIRRADQLIPYDPSKRYRFSFQAKQVQGGANFYSFIEPVDADGNDILPQHYMHIAGTTTTLAEDLKPGDTQIKLTSAANWFGSAAKPAGGYTYLRGIIAWDYTDGQGKTWPTGSYSRRMFPGSLWADGGVDLTTNTITLTNPWPTSNGTITAGTDVSNGTTGNSYLYAQSNLPAPATWTQYTRVTAAGVASRSKYQVATSGSLVWDDGLPEATSQIRIGWLTNYPPRTGDPRFAIANVSFSDAAAASAVADQALASADGKSTLHWSVSDPTAADPGKDGDIWWVRDAEGRFAKAYEYRDGTWQSRSMSSEIIDSISAAQITTGTMAVGQKITTGDPAGAHTILGESSLEVWRPDPEGVPQKTISIGGTEADQLLITDPVTGDTLAGFNDQGDGVARDFEVNTLFVGGQSLGDKDNPNDILWPFPRGVVAGYQPSAHSPNIGTSECGYFEASANLVGGRVYQVIVRATPYIVSGNARFVRTHVRASFASASGAAAPAPTVSSDLYAWQNHPWTNNTTASVITAYIRPDWPDGEVREARFLVSGYAYDGTVSSPVFSYNYSVGNQGLVVIDQGASPSLGPVLLDDGQLTTGGGSPAGGGTPTPPATVKKTYTKTYTASWSRGWRGSTITGNELRHGYYSGTKYTGMFGFPSQLQSDLSGSTISRMRVYVYANHWYYSSGGTGYFGCVGNSSAPSSPPAPGVGDYVFSGKWSTKSGGLWMNVPSGSWPHWVSGAIKSISVGDFVSSTSLSYYSRYNGVGMSYPPKIEVTYTK